MFTAVNIIVCHACVYNRKRPDNGFIKGIHMKNLMIVFILLSTVSCASVKGYKASNLVVGAALDCANAYLKDCCKTDREIGGW